MSDLSIWSLLNKMFFVSVSSLISFSVYAADLYVSPSGNDSNVGSQAAPLRTILKASQLAKPGTVVNVASGTYTGGFQTRASGTASARITYKSVTKWGAKIVPSSSKVMWDNRGNYTDIVGFDIDGSGSSIVTNGIYIGGSNNLVQNNHVHHLATTSVCNSGGGSAIGTDHYYGGLNDDVISNVVHHIGSPNCPYIQGIYISTSGNVKNNLAYNIGAAAIHLWHDATSVNIINNTTASSGYGIIVGGGDFYNSSNGMADNCNVINNISFDNEYGISEQGRTGPSNRYLNNLVFQNSIKDWDLDSGKSHSGSIAANPQFVAYNRLGTSVDFHLKSTSPALNSGTATLAPPADLGGMARPQGGSFDRGAYELASVAPTPTPVPKPIMSLSTQSLIFGNQLIGSTSAIQIVTIKNTGTAALSFPAGFVMSGDFAFGGSGTCAVGVSYAPGASCTASVVFKPTIVGARSGGLSILSNASATAVVVKLSGTGTSPTPKPILSLSTQSLVFASQSIGTTSAIQIVTIKNTGTAALSFPAGFVMSGDFAFGGLGTCAVGVSYAPGASCTASVVFKPKATGVRAGGLSILSNASTTAVVVKLSGTGK